MFASFVLRDVFCACGERNECFIRNDGIDSIQATIQFEYWILSEPKPIHTSSKSVSLIGGVGATERFTLDAASDVLTKTEVVLIQIVDETNKETILMKDNAFLQAVPASIAGLKQKVEITAQVVGSNGNSGASVVLKANALALYVTLTTTCQGHFSENAIHLRPNEEVKVDFVPPRNSPAPSVDELKSSLRVEHLGMYMTSSS